MTLLVSKEKKEGNGVGPNQKLKESKKDVGIATRSKYPLVDRDARKTKYNLSNNEAKGHTGRKGGGRQTPPARGRAYGGKEEGG